MSARSEIAAGLLLANDPWPDRATVIAQATDELRRRLHPSTVWQSAYMPPNLRGSVAYGEELHWWRARYDMTPEEEQALEAAWSAALLPLNRRIRRYLRGMPRFLREMRRYLRVRVDSPHDIERLRTIGEVDGLIMVPSLDSRGRMRPLWWRWPFRVGVVPGPLADKWLKAVRRTSHNEHVFDAELFDAAGTYDIAIVSAAELSSLPVDIADRLGEAACVIVAGDGPVEELLMELDRRIEPSIAVAVAAPPAQWWRTFFHEMSHNVPIDAAVETIVREKGVNALIAGPRYGMDITAAARWFAAVAPAFPSLAPSLDGYANWDWRNESGGTRRETDEVRAERARGGDPVAFVPPPAMAAPKNGGEDTATPVVDERRLQAELRDESGLLRKDAFVAGQRHQLRIRIAAERLDGAIIAPGLFRSPTPGREAKLSVMTRLRRAGQKPVIRALSLPATEDSKWTRPIPLDIPREESFAIIEVVVLHQGRTVQAATLSGPVVAPSDPIGSEGLVFAIDADTPVHGLESRTPADATIVLSPSLGDAPEVIDLTAGASPIRLDRLQQSMAQIRQQLIGAFGHPPKDLADAAPLLARLAIKGASLRDALGGGTGYHDDATWVHVLAYDQADLPFEVIYTHPEPVSRDVPVCAPALAGETTCRLDCPDRASAERVCPYAFWGTNKVVERRWYVADRSKNKPPTTRRITIAARAVVGTSNQTDHEDRTASQRIRSSIEKFVGQQNVFAVPTWKELPAAVANRPPPSLLVLVTHTIPASEDDNTDVSLELGGMGLEARLVGLEYVNPANAEPGPMVLSLGCDTNDLTIGFNNWVGRLRASGAEVVVSTLSPVPGKEVADFVVRVFDELPRQLRGPGQHRLGSLLTAVRKATMATGDPLALTITAWGDADVELV